MKTITDTADILAANLIAKVRAGIGKGAFTHRSTTWTYENERLDKHDDTTGDWHTVGHFDQHEAVRLIAERIADTIRIEGDDSLRHYVSYQMELEEREKEGC